MFKLLVCGGRDYADEDAMRAVLDRIHAKHKDLFIIHGGARGADDMAGRWAKALMRSGDYPMFREEPEYCAGSMLATVEALWKARKEIAKLRARLEVSP